MVHPAGLPSSTRYADRHTATATGRSAGQLVTTGRRRILRLARHWPWTGDITAALERLAVLPDPG
ncbi:hypothetical protein [Streptomyces sp. NPDC047706]|uniref:hypothetical protein n=1 Tax=Streptomyces sp. NPDC047706 TaxID=3365486 RepID=UPI00371DFF31